MQSLSEADKASMGLAVALSVGELSEEQYAALYAAGARRYLLRIETSNPELYTALHPPSMSWQARVDCLHALKRVGLQLGTGIMVGLPGQTLRDLAGDLVFFRTMGANMIGMGPYITEEGTPVAAMWSALYGHLDKAAHMRDMFQLTTRMNALARITLGSANIAATTALQAIDPNGREIALRRGANILMPILTPTK
jgi:biotin synthase-like enzyme